MVKSLDESVGDIMKTLDSLGLTENTIVIFTSDNGGFGPVTDMSPLKGSKGMLYEGGIREPFIVSWKGKVKAGTISDYPIIGTDLFPTILSLTGSELPKGLALDGTDLKRIFLTGAIPEKRALFWFFPAYLENYRGMPGIWRTTPAAAIRYGNFKLIRFFEDGREELYDLKNDIGEKNDLAKVNKKKREELSRMLDNWITGTHAPVPAEPNPDFDEKLYQKRLNKTKAVK
jgi:arylsulfatase A-like enzyme